MGKIDELLRRCPLLPHVRQELAGRFLIALMLAGMALLVVDLRIHTGGSVYLLYSVPLVLSLFIARRGSSYAVMGTITALILVGLIMRYLWVQPTTPPANAHVISGFVAIVCGWAVAIVLERDRAAVMRLADQEADLRLMADIGPTLIAHLDVDLRYIRVNRVFEEWFGLTSEQVRGKTGKEILGEKAWQAIAPYIEQAMAGRTATYEQFMTYAGGREFWVHATLTPEKDDGGRVIGLVVHAIDISDRKKVEDRLRLSEARISAFISQSPLATIVFAPDGRPIETNRAWEETFGYGLEEIREYNALDDKEMEAKGVMSYVRRGFGGEAVAIPAFRYQPTGPRMAGRDWSIKAYIYPVRDDAGAVSRVVMTMIDLTQLEDVEKHLQETLKEAGKTAEAARQRSRALETIFRSIPELIAVYDNPGGILRFASQMYLDFYGLRSDAVGTAQLEQVLASVPMSRIDDHGSVDVDQRPVYRALRKGETVAHDELGVTKPDGSRVVLLAAAAPVRNDQGDIAYAVVAYRDITANRATAEALQASEYELRTLVENTPDLIARFDARGRYTYANPAFERMSGLIQDQLAGKTNSELGMPSSTEAVLRDALERAAGTRRETNVEFRFAGLFGERHFQGKVIPEFGPKGQVASSMLVARDITEIKQAEEHVKFISFHDTVTGLYTRTYLEEEVTRIDTERQLPISVIAGDANNLKLMNDAFGHEEGDRLLRSIANAARACCRDEDIIARWGGDEFVILLPKTPLAVADEIAQRIIEGCGASGETVLPPSVALGTAAKTTTVMDLQEVMREAESRMYERKALDSRRNQDLILQGLLAKLERSSPEVEAYLVRVTDLARSTAGSMGLADAELADLANTVLLHELGKVTVPERIIRKPGPLDDKEWPVMQRHSQTGFRIARAADAYAHLANTVHSLHERWDGTGYPRGLAGEETPLMARAIAIAIAFDVMTHDQPYRRRMSTRKALAELEQNAGTQFDARLVREFVKQVSAPV